MEKKHKWNMMIMEVGDSSGSYGGVAAPEARWATCS